MYLLTLVLVGLAVLSHGERLPMAGEQRQRSSYNQHYLETMGSLVELRQSQSHGQVIEFKRQSQSHGQVIEFKRDRLCTLLLLLLTCDLKAAWQCGASGLLRSSKLAGPQRCGKSITMQLGDAPGPMNTIEQAAFLDLVTVDTVADAPAVFSRYGVVRVPGVLSSSEVTSLLKAAQVCGLRRDAYAQSSQSDRFTLWLAGDGLSTEEQAATEALRAQLPCCERALFGGDASSWRRITDAFGWRHLALAEVVTSLGGGAPQKWHFDGEGITAQISLVRIGELQGPTEVHPRVLSTQYVRWREFQAQQGTPSSLAEFLEELTMLPTSLGFTLQRLFYDVQTAAHELAWNALRPVFGNSHTNARELIKAGLTPAVVYLTGEVGCLTLYDSAMIHRGGQNLGETERPILAVHMRKDDGYMPNPSTVGPGVFDAGQVSTST